MSPANKWHAQTEYNLLKMSVLFQDGFLAKNCNPAFIWDTQQPGNAESTGQLSSKLFKHLHVQSADLIPALPVRSQIFT